MTSGYTAAALNLLRHQLRWVVGLALVAMAALALLPTLTHALARAAGGASSSFTEVCTPQGTRLVALADGETAPDSALLQLEHCSWCTAALGDLAPPPVVLRHGLPAAGAGFVPPLFLQAPHTLHAWASAQARAPPLRA